MTSSRRSLVASDTFSAVVGANWSTARSTNRDASWQLFDFGEIWHLQRLHVNDAVSVLDQGLPKCFQREPGVAAHVVPEHPLVSSSLGEQRVLTIQLVAARRETLEKRIVLGIYPSQLATSGEKRSEFVFVPSSEYVDFVECRPRIARSLQEWPDRCVERENPGCSLAMCPRNGNCLVEFRKAADARLDHGLGIVDEDDRP